MLVALDVMLTKDTSGLTESPCSGHTSQKCVEDGQNNPEELTVSHPVLFKAHYVREQAVLAFVFK